MKTKIVRVRLIAGLIVSVGLHGCAGADISRTGPFTPFTPEQDVIQPTKIEHRLDDFADVTGHQAPRYNYIVYHFEGENSYIWARASLDMIERVSIYGPFVGVETRQKINDPDHFEKVADYLKRRYTEIDVLDESRDGARLIK